MRIKKEYAKLQASIKKSPLKEEFKKQPKRKDSDDTSEENNLMADTPSNYNIANQRFDPDNQMEQHQY